MPPKASPLIFENNLFIYNKFYKKSKKIINSSMGLFSLKQNYKFQTKIPKQKNQRALKAEFEIHPVFPSLNLIFDQVS
tara:strand:- start:59 stop:292 length:234 start_codon:yes stop_codon:yes gene_type:complete